MLAILSMLWMDVIGRLPGDWFLAWDLADPLVPRLTSEVTVDARTVNDVMIRAGGTLAVLTHEGSLAGLNGVTLLDLADPLRPTVYFTVCCNLHPLPT